MRLKFALLCNYAGYLESRTPLMVGVFDFMRLPEPDAGAPIVLMPFFLVLAVGASSFEAGKHNITVRMIDEDGKEGGRMTVTDMPFTEVVPGYELGAYILHQIVNLAVPHFGDYVFEVLAGPDRLGDVRMSVVPIEREALLGPFNTGAPS